MSHAPRVATLAAAFALASCAIDHTSFRPREHVDGESPEGWPAASYLLVAPDGASVGEARIWSAGVDREPGGASLHVGFEIENRSSAPMAVALARTEVVDVDAGTQPAAPVAAPLVVGAQSVEPQRVGVLELRYPLPASVEPDDVRAFAVRWTLQIGADQEFAQHTGFRREPPPPHYWDDDYAPFPWHGYGSWRCSR